MYNIHPSKAFKNSMRLAIATIFFVLFTGIVAFSQKPMNVNQHKGLYLLETVVIDGDTIPVVTLRTTLVSDRRKSRSRRYQRKWSKMQRNVIKTYPYAQVAGELIREYNKNLEDLETEAEREAYMDRCEEDLKAEFEGELKEFSMSEGRTLIKLIDRETGNTSYELIKDLKSGFAAFMWQGVAKLFGGDLKTNFNPEENEKDNMIEAIVAQIERGAIHVKTREIKTPEAHEVLKDKSRRLKRRIEREKRRMENNG
jgi:hypothetical protein